LFRVHIYSLIRRLCENCPVVAWRGKFCLGRSPKPTSKVNNKNNLQAGLLQVENAHFICTTTFVGPLLNEGI
jgi:hypothetical protein